LTDSVEKLRHNVWPVFNDVNIGSSENFVERLHNEGKIKRKLSVVGPKGLGTHHLSAEILRSESQARFVELRVERLGVVTHLAKGDENRNLIATRPQSIANLDESLGLENKLMEAFGREENTCRLFSSQLGNQCCKGSRCLGVIGDHLLSNKMMMAKVRARSFGVKQPLRGKSFPILENQGLQRGRRRLVETDMKHDLALHSFSPPTPQSHTHSLLQAFRSTGQGRR